MREARDTRRVRALAKRMNQLFDLYNKWGWHALQYDVVVECGALTWKESEKFSGYDFIMIIINHALIDDPELKFNPYLHDLKRECT